MSTIKPSLHHVTLKTTRLQDMIDWYKCVLGVKVNFQDPNNAWTTNDTANHRIAFLSVPELRDDPQQNLHTGMHHSAFEYDGFDDLMASYARMRDEGVAPAFSLHHGLTVSLYYRDPDGNHVELQADCFGDWTKSTHYMCNSEDFRANPIGTFFDPEAVYQAHRGGETFDALNAGMRRGDFLPATIPSIGLPEPEKVMAGM